MTTRRRGGDERRADAAERIDDPAARRRVAADERHPLLDPAAIARIERIAGSQLGGSDAAAMVMERVRAPRRASSRRGMKKTPHE
ncbi:hypothetical protein [Burkholderia anthina]|uniref:hypothetical protein n=1 Tax=Burkholderia anthina TaxID=179879 RepID=UPI0015895A73|nr:hypothetical protein [Burkholderia anthina]